MKNLYITFMALPLFAFANFGVGITSNSVNDVDSGSGYLDWRVATLNGVYENRNNNLAFQAKLGIGLGDDSANDDDGDSYDFEIKNIIQLKGMYFFNDNIYGALTYTRLDAEINIDWANETVSEDDSDFGFLLGYRNNNVDIYFGPSYDKGGGDGEVVELGFTYFFN